MSSSICKFYSLGHCAKGSKCPFVHDDSGICVYYQSGDCRFGNKCALRHVKVNKGSKPQHMNASKAAKSAQSVKEIVKLATKSVKYSEIVRDDAISALPVSEPTSNELLSPPESFVPMHERSLLCPFKDCKFGKVCKYKHGLECHICKGKVLHPQASLEEYQGKFSHINN